MRKKPFTVIGAAGTQPINTTALNSIELAPSEENINLAVEVGTQNFAPTASRKLRYMAKKALAEAKAFSKLRAKLRAKVKETQADAKTLRSLRPLRRGRKQGAMSKAGKHIKDLALKYPDRSAKELEKLADDSIIDEMSSRTFANHVSAARNPK